jgi:hypothetical protein
LDGKPHKAADIKFANFQKKQTKGASAVYGFLAEGRLAPSQKPRYAADLLCETEHRLLRSAGMSTGGREINVRQHNG